MALLRPTRLLISEKYVTYTIKRSYTIIWQIRVYDFKTYFFPLGEVAASFLNLLSIAIKNFIKPKVDLFRK